VTVEDPHPCAEFMTHGSHRLSLADVAAHHAGLDPYGADRNAIHASLLYSDFGNSLAGALSKVIGIDYSVQAKEHSQIVLDMQVRGMRPANVPVLDLGELTRTPNGFGPAEWTRMAIQPGAVVRPYVWSAVFGIGREMLVNDDSGVIALAGRQLSGHCARLESKRIADLLNANANLADGLPLIGTGNDVMAAASEMPPNSAIGMAFNYLRTALTPSGNKGNVNGKFLLVSPLVEEWALERVHNLSSGSKPRLTIVVNPWLSQYAAYMLADPRESAVFIRSRPEGFPLEPTILRLQWMADQKTGEPVYYEGQILKVEHVIGIDAVSRQGIVRMSF
jgi:hypothetical protein